MCLLSANRSSHACGMANPIGGIDRCYRNACHSMESPARINVEQVSAILRLNRWLLEPMKSILLVVQDQTFSARAREALDRSGRFVVYEEANVHGFYKVAQRVQPALMLVEITPETTSALALEILAHPFLQQTLIVFLTDDDSPGGRWRDPRLQQYVWPKKWLKIDELVPRVDETLSAFDLLPT